MALLPTLTILFTFYHHVTNTMSSKQAIPLIHITTNTEQTPPSNDASRSLVHALQNSGFLLVKSPLLTAELQADALQAARSFLETDTGAGTDAESKGIIRHPSDPKIYAMLDSVDQCNGASPILKEYMQVMQTVKMDLLRHVAVGLGMKDTHFLAKLHSEHNDTLRLINYYPTNSQETGNRCKAHSDYGTITLLSTDGVSGLEAFHNGQWIPVPHVKGALVVNIGSLLSGWTKGSLRATLHRVAGPASPHSQSRMEDLLEAVKHTRTSMAFFADPNENVAESLAASGKEENGLVDALEGMSVSEYIEWRSGGSGSDRSGIGFTSADEKQILDELNAE